MPGHNRKGRTKNDRFVKLPNWMLDSPAYLSLKPGPRSLLVELYKLYNGRNNGELFFSSREAARRLNVTKHTALGYFDDLRDRGFIKIHIKGSFDHKSSKGTVWILTEHPVGESTPTKDFMRWNGIEKQHRDERPKRKTRCQESTLTVSKNDAAVSKLNPVGEGYDVENRHPEAEIGGSDGVENRHTDNIPSGGSDSAHGAQPQGSAAPSARLSVPNTSSNGTNATPDELGTVSQSISQSKTTPSLTAAFFTRLPNRARGHP